LDNGPVLTISISTGRRDGGLPPVSFSLPGGSVELSRDQVEHLRDAAAARAGRSSAARDLSLVLVRALHQATPVALRRAEVDLLSRIAHETGLHLVVAALAAAQAA
jgi:hypothetical protein